MDPGTRIEAKLRFALQRYLTAERSIEAAHEHGYDSWYLDASLSTDTPERWPDGRIESILRRVEETGCHPVIHGNFRLPLASETRRVRAAAIEEVKSELELAAKFSAPLIIHGGSAIEPRNSRESISESLHRLTDSLQEVCNSATTHRVEVWLENLSAHRTHPFYYLATISSEFEHLLSQIKDLKVFFDVGHANVNAQSLGDFIQLVLPRLAGVSLSDNRGIHDTHSPLGSGTAPIEGILSTLIAAQWKGLVGLEVRGSDPKVDLQQVVSMIARLRPPS